MPYGQVYLPFSICNPRVSRFCLAFNMEFPPVYSSGLTLGSSYRQIISVLISTVGKYVGII